MMSFPPKHVENTRKRGLVVSAACTATGDVAKTVSAQVNTASGENQGTISALKHRYVFNVTLLFTNTSHDPNAKLQMTNNQVKMTVQL